MVFPVEKPAVPSLERIADDIDDFSNIFNDDIDIECVDGDVTVEALNHLRKPLNNDELLDEELDDANATMLIDEFCQCFDDAGVKEEDTIYQDRPLTVQVEQKQPTKNATAPSLVKLEVPQEELLIGYSLAVPVPPTSRSLVAPLPPGISPAGIFLSNENSSALQGLASKAEYRKTIAIPRYLAKRKKRRWGKSKAMYDTRTKAANKRARRNGKFSRSAVFVSVTDFY
eukprot:CAMPEP_0185781592 /NCGR_PEP_ID=MMETSP1174-20130828/102974_1 /TAXON_ID=35687 /ORGANISM="Dictyocha speculum, Strain CCMP1381" /LENGTH=227 /DNA_ID=CAMNT_0028471641 /DNA_START=313 /DNA_END=996 /DNA_ORIENTATION=+